MKTHKNLYQRLCSKENLTLAYQKAKKGKSLKPYVREFNLNLKSNMAALESELLSQEYIPKPLKTFIVREPKTRKIRKSHFRDRIVHHAICNVLSPIFEKTFIHDSYANQVGKGSLKALERFDHFKRKASRNNKVRCFVLKADVRKYFEKVDHEVLLNILGVKIRDEQFIGLVRKVLNNHSENVGMPLGNMTSKFFANVYLNLLDQFVKHELKAKFYIRYVDDFVILHENEAILEGYRQRIEIFLRDVLKLELHQTKTKILRLDKGIPFLGFRIFHYHRLLRRANLLSIKRQVETKGFESVSITFEGWLAYAKHAATYGLRKRIARLLDSRFPGDISGLQIDRVMKYARRV